MTARTPSRPTLQLALALALPLFACGPIGATNVMGDAEIAVSRAHASDGDKLAIYETTSADLYLEKAREEQGHAHYGAAMELAKKSQELADAASQKAALARTVATPPPLPRATVTHQAGENVPSAKPPAIAPLPAEPPPPLIVPAPGNPTVIAPVSAPPTPSAPSMTAPPPPAPSTDPQQATPPRTPVIIPRSTP